MDATRRRELLQSLENGKGIAYLMEKAYEILGNPIYMNDTSYKLLMYTQNPVTDDDLCNELVELRHFSHETVDLFNRIGFIKAFAETEIVTFMGNERFKYDRYNGKLFDSDGVQLGNICVVGCIRPFEPDDPELIELLCELFSVELQNSEFYSNIERVYQENVINRLIHGDAQIDLGAGDWDPYEGLHTNLFAAVIDISQYEHTLTHLAYFRDLFRELHGEYRYYIHLTSIVCIINTEDKLFRPSKHMPKLLAFFEKYNIFAGVSSRFQSLFDLKKYYQEALNALNYGHSLYPRFRVFDFNDFRVEHFFHSVKDIADTQKIISPTLTAIREYDAQNSTQLCNTLYTYLLYGRDYQLTRNALGISDDDLRTRLALLEDEFALDWTNGNMNFSLFLSVKMLEA